MNHEIKVHVTAYGPGRKLVMRYRRIIGQIRNEAKVRIDKPSQGMRRHWITTIARSNSSRAEVQRLARHASYKTTDAYYVDIDTDALEESLLSVPFARVGNGLGNTARNEEVANVT